MNENETLPDWLTSEFTDSSENTPSLVVGEPAEIPSESTTSENTSSNLTSSELTQPPLTASELADIINSTIAENTPSESITSETTSSTIAELSVMEKPFTGYTTRDFNLTIIMICAVVGLAVSVISLIKRK